MPSAAAATSAPPDNVRRLYERAEAQTAAGFEKLVAGDAFGELLARTTENVAGLAKLWLDAADLAVRNLRIAGRTDVARLQHQLGRNEDKLERVLQEVEALRDELRGPR